MSAWGCGWMNGWMDGWMDAWMDGQMSASSNIMKHAEAGVSNTLRLS